MKRIPNNKRRRFYELANTNPKAYHSALLRHVRLLLTRQEQTLDMLKKLFVTFYWRVSEGRIRHALLALKKQKVAVRGHKAGVHGPETWRLA